MLKNIMVNFFVFLIMFLAFDFIIYHSILDSLYNTIDAELEYSKQKYRQKEMKGANNNSETERFLSRNHLATNTSKNINPRIISIIRDENGNVINSINIGRIYDEFGEEITFNKKI